MTVLGPFWPDGSRTTIRAWSHVGIVVRDETGLHVVHMDGSPLGGHIRRESLSTFTRHARFVHPALDTEQRQRLCAWLDGHLVRRTAFDTRFRLDDAPTMYCSELVWQALDHVAMTPGDASLPRLRAGRPPA